MREPIYLCVKKHYRTDHENYKIGELHSDQEYNERYGMIHAMKSAKIAGLTPEEVMMKNVAYLESYVTAGERPLPDKT